MIVTPYKCVNFNAENFKTNLNQTCKLKGRCQLISDKKSCSCKYRPMLDGWDTDETYPDVCGLVNDNEVTEYLYQGRYEIGCKFNQKTLDKRKEKLENFYNNCNEYYG